MLRAVVVIFPDRHQSPGPGYAGLGRQAANRELISRKKHFPAGCPTRA